MRTARLVVVAIAVASALAARAITHFALADVAHVMDEIAYLFQAKIFASGALKAPVLEPRAAFNMWFVDDRTARFAIFPPGWPAFLALGVTLGVPRLVNPLLHLGTVILVGRSGEKMGGPRTGIVAAALYAACPQTVILAASLMSHTLVAACASVVLLAIATVMTAPAEVDRRLIVASGVAIGIAAMTRPLCAIAIAAPIVILIALRAPARHFVLLDAAALPFVLLLGLYDRALTGSMFLPPQTAYFDEHLAPADVPFFTYGPGCNALGFGHACDHTVRAAKHTLVSALSDAGDNLTAWVILIGPIVLGAAVWAARNRSSRVLLAPAGLVIVLYGLYWQAGVCYGARFYQAAVPALVVAAALVLQEKRWILGLALALNLGGFVVATRELTSWPFWGTDDRFAKVVREWHDGPAVVLVEFGQDDVKSPALHAMGAQGPGTWLLGIRALSALGENSPAGHDGVLFAKYHPALVEQLTQNGRPLWLYTAWADRAKDTLVPLTRTPIAPPIPPPNFDGYRIGPPFEAPAPLFTEPR